MWRPKRVYVAEEVLSHPYTQEILSRLKVKAQVVSETPPLPLLSWPEAISWGKETLFLTRYKGRFFRPCPGTKAYRCCGYRIFHIGQGCPLDCTYCILQAYFNRPWLTFFVNVTEEGFKELEEALASQRRLRIGTGEFTDSFAFEVFTRLNLGLIELFARQDRSVLELKTKTTAIEHLKDLPHRRRTILAWSLNAPTITQSEERRAPSVFERIRAAQEAAAWGYPVAFHFDPLIRFPGWKKEYEEVIEQLFQALPAENIVWISLGSLRFMPELKEIAWRRFPKTKIFSDEFIVGLDGKRRYFRPLRVELYRHLYQAIRRRSKDVCVYLCMESDEVWQEAFGFRPQTQGGLPRMLDEAAKRVCGLS